MEYTVHGKIEPISSYSRYTQQVHRTIQQLDLNDVGHYYPTNNIKLKNISTSMYILDEINILHITTSDKNLTILIIANENNNVSEQYFDMLRKTFEPEYTIINTSAIYLNELILSILGKLHSIQYRFNSTSPADQHVPESATTFEFYITIRYKTKIFYINKQINFGNSNDIDLKIIKQKIKSVLTVVSKFVNHINDNIANIAILDTVVHEINFRYGQNISMFSASNAMVGWKSIFAQFNGINGVDQIDFDELEMYTEYKFNDHQSIINQTISKVLERTRNRRSGAVVIYSKYGIRISGQYTMSITMFGYRLKYSNHAIKAIFTFLIFIRKFEEFLMEIEKQHLLED